MCFCFSFSRIRIQAVNEIGAGPFSQFIKAKTRPLPPLPPRLECAAAGPQSLKLKWGDSNSKTHAADDMVYTLQLEDRNKRYSGAGVLRAYAVLLWGEISTVHPCLLVLTPKLSFSLFKGGTVYLTLAFYTQSCAFHSPFRIPKHLKGPGVCAVILRASSPFIQPK